MRKGCKNKNGRKFFKVLTKEYFYNDEKKITVCKLFITPVCDCFGKFGSRTIEDSVKHVMKEFEYDKESNVYVITTKTTCAEEDVYSRDRGRYVVTVKAMKKVYKLAGDVLRHFLINTRYLSETIRDTLINYNHMWENEERYIEILKRSK